MKILFVQDSLGTGGAERSNACIWYFLREKKVSVKIVVLEHRKVGIEREIIEAGFDVQFLRAGKIFKQVRELAKIIEHEKPDIVHSVLFKAAIRTRLAKLIIPFFHIESLVNCTYDEVRFNDPKVNRHALWMYKHLDKYTQKKGTDQFIAITEEVRQHYIKNLNIPLEKISVIYRGRDNNPYINKWEAVKKEVRKEFDLRDRELIFIHVGRQEFQKGHLVILKALKEVEKSLVSPNITILFCGREGNASASIQEFINNNPLKTNIQWLGHRPDIPRLLVGADAFLFPSLYEGLGGALIEAQAAGLPVICSDLKVFEEVVEKGVNALTFETGNEKAMAGAMMNLTADEHLRQEMGKASLENFKRKFQMEDINQQMLNCYYSFYTKQHS